MQASRAVGRWDKVSGSIARNYTHSMGARRHNMWRIQSGYDVEEAEESPMISLEHVARSQQQKSHTPQDACKAVDGGEEESQVKRSQVLPEGATGNGSKSPSRRASNAAPVDVITIDELTVPWDKLVHMLDKQQEEDVEITDDECQEVNDDVMVLMRQLRKVNGVYEFEDWLAVKPEEHYESVRWAVAHWLESTSVKIIIIMMVLLNTLLVGVQTDTNGDKTAWLAVEICFVVFFVVEIVVKMVAMGFYFWHNCVSASLLPQH